MGLLSRANETGGASKADGVIPLSVLNKLEISKEELDLILVKISQYHELYPDFGCIFFENPHQESDKEDFCKKLSEMIGTIGIIIQTSQNLPLILLPPEMDLELVTHRLSKSLNAKPIFFISANNPWYVINRIKPLL